MKKIDWVRKLTSRKLWTAVASFVSMMILATGGTDNTATQVTALIMAGASVVAYIIGLRQWGRVRPTPPTSVLRMMPRNSNRKHTQQGGQ